MRDLALMSPIAIINLIGYSVTILLIGYHLGRLLHWREVKSLPVTPKTHPLPSISHNDQQWLEIFREAVLESEGVISPTLEQILSLNNNHTDILETAKSKESAQETERTIKTLNAQILAMQSKCGRSGCPHRPDPRCKAGNCGDHCFPYCPINCRVQSKTDSNTCVFMFCTKPTNSWCHNLYCRQHCEVTCGDCIEIDKQRNEKTNS